MEKGVKANNQFSSYDMYQLDIINNKVTPDKSDNFINKENKDRVKTYVNKIIKQ
jgi:hypothetical protein